MQNELSAIRDFAQTVRYSGDKLTANEAVKRNSNLTIGQVIVRVASDYFRPSEVDTLLGDPTLAKNELGWEPKTSFCDLVKEMVDEDLKSLS